MNDFLDKFGLFVIVVVVLFVMSMGAVSGFHESNRRKQAMAYEAWCNSLSGSYTYNQCYKDGELIHMEIPND